jgi:DMSO/TMAO reductase YedYZ molybdopterin-dependent catalytic subunit
VDAKDIIISPDTKRDNRTPPGQHLTDKWPVLHYGSVPKIQPDKWKLRVFGLVEKEKLLSYDEFQALPQVKVFADIHCVTTWSRLDNLWQGVSTSGLKQIVNITPGAKYVIVHASGSFTTNLPITEFFEPDVLLATKHNDIDISADHGGPVRLVVPRLYFWKSAKWVTGIEFTDKDRPGFWESAGYHNHGDPWKEERYGGR